MSTCIHVGIMIYSFTLALFVLVVVVAAAAVGISRSCSSRCSVAESVECWVVRVITSIRVRVSASTSVCALVDVVTCTIDSTWFHVLIWGRNMVMARCFHRCMRATIERNLICKMF